MWLTLFICLRMLRPCRDPTTLLASLTSCKKMHFWCSALCVSFPWSPLLMALQTQSESFLWLDWHCHIIFELNLDAWLWILSLCNPHDDIIRSPALTLYLASTCHTVVCPEKYHRLWLLQSELTLFHPAVTLSSLITVTLVAGPVSVNRAE